MSSRFGRSRSDDRLETDVFGGFEEDDPGQGFDAIRNPDLGPWQETVKSRILVGVMFSVPVIALVAVWIGWGARSNANESVALVNEISVRPTPEWQPSLSAAADVAAHRVAADLGMTLVSRFDTLDQAERVGFTSDHFIGTAPDVGSFVPRRAWIEGVGVERYAYLLQQGDRFEALSFFVETESGQISWPVLTPLDEGEIDASGFGRVLDEEASLSAETERASADVYELMRSGMGIASDEALPTSCGVAAAADAPMQRGLSARIEEFVRAYTAQDAEAVREIANSGADWPLYVRQGWRYREGSMRVLCLQFDESVQSGLAQVWWAAEFASDPSHVIPEVRDVIVADNLGLWQVSGASTFMSGGYRPEAAEPDDS